MRTPCQRGAERKSLKYQGIIFRRGAARGVSCRARGKFCRAFTARLTIPGHLWRASGALPRAGPGSGLRPSHAHLRIERHRPGCERVRRPRRAASGGFSVDEGEAPKSTAPAASLRTIGGIDALIALQGEDDPARAAAPRGQARHGSRSMRWTSSSSRCWAARPALDPATAEVGHRRTRRRLGRRTAGSGAGRDRASPGGRDRQD